MSIFDNLKGRTIVYGKVITDEQTGEQTFVEDDELIHPVRCKDCKFRYTDGDNVVANYCLLAHNRVQPDDWYCADGERREE